MSTSRHSAATIGTEKQGQDRGFPQRVAWSVLAFCALVGVWLTGCTQPRLSADLAALYDRAAMAHGPDRNPVIVIPGILGSRLVDGDTGQTVWGAFTPAAANPNKPEEARLLAVPMRRGVALSALTDNVHEDGALDRVKVSVLGLPVQLEAYAQILATLGVGGYRDQQLAEAGAVDYGDDHYSCFQFAYDWRRDNVENAQRLHRYILDRRGYVQQNLAERYGGLPDEYDVKFDIVAHSMGGLITRYMLRYGDAELVPGQTPGTVTWAGARHVERVVLVGTPNAGAALAVKELVEGKKFAPIFPTYEPALLGTMPAIYQLMPRGRHGALQLTNADGSTETLDPLSFKAWVKHGWGLADPAQDGVLQKLLPEVESAEERRAVALEHLAKCLERAQQFHAALDRPAAPPEGLTLQLFAGDAVPTLATLAYDPGTGDLSDNAFAPGDGTVTRASALMDERLGADWSPRLRTPVGWAGVTFLHEDHLGLTQSATFSDNVLFLLLEQPEGRTESGAMRGGM